ncbi:hypothetical protein HPP92_015074 [Vanilla planifolia]|uniref:Gnk2-homologous domain-containing protein n=1 Tax=Vanilla planifolia TaxID=51239 RepID=A0A835UVF6_VANPL|nr:hypothetical protein HPP92_015586 [Vanilla planifolia]KAG0475388.1 hypothetical protein HPP92_015074 [Vanilla planifolia]
MAFFCKFILLLALLPIASCIPPFTCTISITNENHASNIKGALADLVASSAETGFAKSHINGDEEVYALTQCRGDISGQACKSCVTSAAKMLGQYCANYADAFIWYDRCFIHYAKQNFFGSWKVDANSMFKASVEDAPNPSTFSGVVSRQAQKVSNMAEHSAKLFAKISQPVKEIKGLNINIMAQCTKDLTAHECAECLDWLREAMPTNCQGKKWCQLLHTSCIIRYDTKVTSPK